MKNIIAIRRGLSPLSILLLLVFIHFESGVSLAGLKVVSIEKFMDNAFFDALSGKSNELLLMRRDADGIFQLYIVKAHAADPEAEKICISCKPAQTIGIESSMVPRLHKGASDWHHSGEWFVTEMEIPNNPSWQYKDKLPGARLLAQPGAGWWNNLFLVKRDGNLWIRLTHFTPSDLNSGVLYPKFSKNGKTIAWAERVGGAKPFDRFPFARWVLKMAQLDLASKIPLLTNVRTYPMRDGTIFEPQEWSDENKLLFAADIGYSNLPYPGFRIDVWEAQVGPGGTIHGLTNLTKTNDFYEEQASYSPDKKSIAYMANIFDLNYEKRLKRAWKRYGSKYNPFITRNLSTDLYVMDRKGTLLTRLTQFAARDWKGHHPLVTRSAWSQDGKTLLIALTLRSNKTGKRARESIYRIRLGY